MTKMSRLSLNFCVVLWISFSSPVFGGDVETLRMIQLNLAANNSKLKTLVAKYDVSDRILAPTIDRNNMTVDEDSLRHLRTESSVRIWLRHGKGQLRVEYEEKAGTRQLDKAGKKLIKQYGKEEHRYLKTPDHFVRFPVYERRIRIAGFPDVAGFGPGKRGRVIYRDPLEASTWYDGNQSRFFDPRLVFSNGSHTHQEFCSLYADALEGLRTEPEKRHVLSNMNIDMRDDGCIAVAVKYISALETEAVFDPAVGYHTVSFRSKKNGKVKEEITTAYTRKDGVYLPKDIKMKFYRDNSKGYTERHFEAVNLAVNSKIDDKVFGLSNLGLEYGDRMADSLTRSLQVWTGDGFVDHSKFKMDASRMRWAE